MAGRKTKLTPERFARLVEDIRAGTYVEVAVERAGIGTTTYYVWLKKAEQGLEPYREFRDAIRLAECEAEADIVRMIRAAVPGDWRAGAFLLERRFQARWKKHEQVDATVTAKLDEEIERRLLKGREANAKGLKA